jgi:imidazolonepropionase
VIVNANELLTLENSTGRPKIGKEMERLGVVKDGAVAVKDGKIVAVGKTEEIKKLITKKTEVVDAENKVVMPGFIDCHTHLVYAGSRVDEFIEKIRGKSYVEILKAGGGILSTVRATRSATEEELVSYGKKILDSMLSLGTTTIEASSGYGLDLKNEIKILKVINTLNKKHCIDIVPTFLGAHAFPPEYKENRRGYVDLIINEMIPEVSKAGLAEYCDVFCEAGFFSVDESREILKRAKEYGLKLKIHSDELSCSHGAELSAELNAVSACHLDYISDEGIKLMAEKGVIGVLLPTVPFHLMTNKYAPARKMIESGMAIALATDYNPGSSPTESMQLVMAMACRQMKLTPEEAIVASTINSAFALNRGDKIGSIEVGKQADFVILDIPNYKHLVYHFGVNLVEAVIKKGKIVINRRF